MDNLEPWNMFTNNMVAEETDEILTDDMVSEYQVGGVAAPSAATCTASTLVPQIKEEPQDTPETNDENADDDDDDERIATDLKAMHTDDNTIFNFGLEPLDVKAAERSMPSMMTRSQRTPQTPSRLSGGGAYCKHDDDSNAINYESGVVYICPACGAEFNAQDAWKRHMNSVHNFNTRSGLNFVQLDRLYHECLECNKRIAMHAMENLLKHKFTHLPYRCTKCKVCLRQYKYRQDLIVHLRTTHRDDLIVLAKQEGAPETDVGHRNGKTTTSGAILAIKDIKENAVDIFESTIEVKNELIDPDDDTATVQAQQHNDIDTLAERSRGSSFALPSFLEEALHGNVSRPSSGTAKEEEDLCERYIQYICPQCETEYANHTQWRQHIEHVHDFGTRKGLNFKEIHMNQHAQCLECNKLIYVNAIRNLQLHKFTHLPHKAWLRCKLCFRQFISHKDLIKHLTQQHRLGGEFEGGDAADDSQDHDSRLDDEEAKPNGGGGFGDDQDLSQSSKFDERDAFEPHIEYLCPQCGREFREKKMWRKHIVKVHHLTDLHVLNFKVINERQVECLECRKIITNAYGVQNAQQHRITHMPYKAYIRCRLCAKSYTDRKGLVKHLNSVHRVGRDSMSLSMSPFAAPPTASTSRSSVAMPSKALQHKRQPQCEIVQHEHYTYEIKYLDDDYGDEDAATAWSMDDDNVAVPELLEYGAGVAGNYSKYLKCLECSSSFETQRALMEHRREVHEFLDLNSFQPQDELRHEMRVYGRGRGRGHGKRGARAVPRSNQSLDEISNCTNSDNDDEMLVPTGDESQNSIDTTPISADVGGAGGGSDNIENNFCYLCPACGVEYKRQMDWRTHINIVHHFDHRAQLNFRPLDRYRYQCKLCGDIVSNSKLKGLQDHKFRHLPFKLYIKCLLCGTCYNHKPNMISHLRQRHNISISSCGDGADSRRTSDSGCDNAAKQYVSRPGTMSYAAAIAPSKPPGLKTVEDCISYHNAVDHDTITYFCPQCNKNFDTHVFWRKHIVEEHNLNCKEGLNFRQIDVHHYLCLECYKRVTVTHTKGAIGQLQSHKFRHLPYRSFKCLACNGLFVRKQMFFKHLNRATYHCDSQPQPQPPSADDDHDDSEYSARIFQPEAVYGNGRGGAASGDATRKSAETIVASSSGSGSGGGGGRGDAFLDLTCFLLLCPQCGIQNESWRSWREHINTAHNLGKREHLNLRRLSTSRHQCRQCLEHVNGNKLRDLQIHKFKHLPFGSFLQCKLCSAAYQRLQGIQNHLQHKHPNAMRKYTQFDQLEQDEDENSVTQNETTDGDYTENNGRRNATQEMTDARMEQQDANAYDEDNDDEADGEDTIDNDVDEEDDDDGDGDCDDDDQDDMDNDNDHVIAVKAEDQLDSAGRGADSEMEIEALDEDEDNDDDVADEDHNDMVEEIVTLVPPHELPHPDEQYLLG